MNLTFLSNDQKRTNFRARVTTEDIDVNNPQPPIWGKPQAFLKLDEAPTIRISANASVVKKNIFLLSKPQGYSPDFVITANVVSNNINLNKQCSSEYALILDELSKLPINWDSYGAEPPNSTALYWARIALNILDEMSFRPNHITPSVENGIGISFISDNKYADIECFNTGEILAVTSDRKEKPNVWKVVNNQDDIKSALENIRVFIRG